MKEYNEIQNVDDSKVEEIPVPVLCGDDFGKVSFASLLQGHRIGVFISDPRYGVYYDISIITA